MKKLYLLLSCWMYFTSAFSANITPSTEFDDCDETISSGYKEPHTTPQAVSRAPEAADSLMQLFLPTAEQDSVEVPQDVLKTEEAAAESAEILEKQPTHSPDLKVYHQRRHGRNIEFVLMDMEALTKKYDALRPGAVLELKFVPEIVLQDVTRARVEHTGNTSVFDTIGWVANVRAWAKWWLNPWAWWNPSHYSLDNQDCVGWDTDTAHPMIHVTTAKDERYLTSQLRLFVLSGWAARFAPYIAPTTHQILERAMMMRFENVEKPALELVGFKDVTLGTRVNPGTGTFERYIRVTK